MQVLLILLLAVMLLAFFFTLMDDKWVIPFVVLALVEVAFLVFYVCRLD